MGESKYKSKKGDSIHTSKDADYQLEGGANGFALCWLNTPCKGKATVITNTPGDYPAVSMYVTANWKAERDMQNYLNDSDFEVKSW